MCPNTSLQTFGKSVIQFAAPELLDAGAEVTKTSEVSLSSPLPGSSSLSDEEPLNSGKV